MERRRATDGRVKKRKAESDLANDRLTKRLGSLKLEAQARPQLYAHIQRRPEALVVIPDATRQIEDEDGMAVDETKHRVYISNLDKEIAEIEAAEEAAKKTIFIPDVEKRLLEQRIPLSVFANKDGDLAGMNRDQALVLYDLPKSLTVDESKDSVRKAMLEARHRAQEKQKREAGIKPAESNSQAQPTLSTPSTTTYLDLDDGVEPMAVEDDGEDGDVMEID